MAKENLMDCPVRVFGVELKGGKSSSAAPIQLHPLRFWLVDLFHLDHHFWCRMPIALSLRSQLTSELVLTLLSCVGIL
jgi:hypothetical protein